MKLLLDTHAFLWFVQSDAALSANALSAICAPANDILLSVASIWELSIKSGQGKIDLGSSIDLFIPRELNANLIDVLPIELKHLYLAGALPLHHRDPFDRLPVAQSLTETIPIVSRDTALDAYGVNRLW
jgi:PIN domain nuclease of toxin-antitoxin system